MYNWATFAYVLATLTFNFFYLQARVDMIGAACDSAEKVISDARKAYGLGTRQGPTVVPTLDKVQAAKIQEQENLLRAAVNTGQGVSLNCLYIYFCLVGVFHITYFPSNVL